MRLSQSISFAAAAFLLSGLFAGQAHDTRKKTTAQPAPSRKAAAVEAEFLRLQKEEIAKLKESRIELEKLLVIQEEDKKNLAEEHENKKELYKKDYIAKIELERAKRALDSAIAKIEETRRWIAENDSTLTEAIHRAELVKVPPLSLGGYSESGTWIRFNGQTAWSLGDAPKITNFFSARFGRPLPVSAFGQTAVHDRLKFDHRDAMDVALHPDTAEGRALMAHLRQAGIPFIAFRGKMAGSATGAHIRIGKPSLRDSAP